MGSFLIAWLVGMTLSITHQEYVYKRVDPSMVSTSKTAPSPFPPKPGKLVVASGIYVGLAILAEGQNTRSLATVLAWGYNIAIGLQFAQDVAQDKTKGSVTGTIRNSGFWSPPTAPDTVVFPTGKASPSATSSSTPTSGTGSGGPLVA